jgi:hypothetical protein
VHESALDRCWVFYFMHVLVKIMLNLFDSYVTPLLCYACEFDSFLQMPMILNEFIDF